MEQQPNHAYQPTLDEDDERWLNEGGHISPVDEPPKTDTESSLDQNDTSSDM